MAEAEAATHAPDSVTTPVPAVPEAGTSTAVPGDDVTTFIPTSDSAHATTAPQADITEFVPVPVATAAATGGGWMQGAVVKRARERPDVLADGLADDSWMRGSPDRRRERAEALVAEDGNAQSLSWSPDAHPAPSSLATLEGRNITAWFGDHQVLDRVSLTMPAGQVTALIGPSGCGKSTFLRILNRMHELIPSASLAGEVLLDGEDIYDPSRKLVEARKHIGMVFQKPNPFPAMSIYDNVVAGLKLTGTRVSRSEKDALVESCLTKAGLWKEVKDRLRAPGAGLSGGQQQRLCIARSLAIKPRVLLMDEPCSALDPTSTRVIEETMLELVQDVTIVIVTHNMQQAQRVSQQCAFFLASQGTPGAIVEHGDTDAMFSDPIDPRTYDYVNGRFG
jgi:phosphate transport system ATP-binding protein